MKKIESKFFLSLLFATLLNGYELDDPTLGNIAIEAGVWNTKLDGNIENPRTTTNFQSDLGFDESKNITSFGLDLKNDYTWLPNVHVNYFTFNSAANSALSSSKSINDVNVNYSGSTTSSIEYSELNTIFYGYFQQSIFEFDAGLNFKKIDYTQMINETDSTVAISARDSDTIKGPDSIIPLPYVALKIDLYPINTVLMGEASILALGDDEARDYKYSINVRVMKHMYLGYGYRYSSWKTTNVDDVHEKYDMNLKGNYFNAKILF